MPRKYYKKRRTYKPRQRINRARIKRNHKRLNWSTSIVNLQFRNALHATGKWVAATDHDLVIYTGKGSAFFLEQKNHKQSLEQTGFVEVSKAQIDHLVKTAGQLQPTPDVILIVYDAQEVQDNKTNSIIYIINLAHNIKSFKVVKRRSLQYVITKKCMASITLGGFISIVNSTLNGPRWARLPIVISD